MRRGGPRETSGTTDEAASFQSRASERDLRTSGGGALASYAQHARTSTNSFSSFRGGANPRALRVRKLFAITEPRNSDLIIQPS